MVRQLDPLQKEATSGAGRTLTVPEPPRMTTRPMANCNPATLFPCNFAGFVPLSDRVEMKPLLPLQHGSNGLGQSGFRVPRESLSPGSLFNEPR